MSTQTEPVRTRPATPGLHALGPGEVRAPSDNGGPMNHTGPRVQMEARASWIMLGRTLSLHHTTTCEGAMG